MAGMQTTAGCPALAYSPESTAISIARLEAAGAILIGKTNMDQFATGLVATRSPYGAVRNAFDPRYISGGSSSGSAIAVAAGLVSFALGTDTAGSGRVPAGFNNIVGLKPTRGLIPATGVFPACRSLDCVSVFALTCGDAMEVCNLAKGPDAGDPFSREAPRAWEKNSGSSAPDASAIRPGFGKVAPTWSGRFRFGVPDQKHLEFFGDMEAADLFRQACARLESMGGVKVEIPFGPFAETAALLYQGPWLAERQAAFGEFLESHPEEVLPVLRGILAPAKSLSAVDGFKAYYRLKELRVAAAAAFQEMDFLLVPTAASHFTIAEVDADPVRLNTRLGYYTNFANLLDLSAIAIPAGLRSSGRPFGVTCLAKAFQEGFLAALGASFHERSGLPMGATGHALPIPVSQDRNPESMLSPADHPSRESVRLAVVGLHLSGQSLNSQLTDLEGRLVGACRTSPYYRLYVLERFGRKIPGLVRVAQGGGAVEVEVWELSTGAMGAFLDKVKEPLCIGSVELETGEKVKGFLCEGYAVGKGAGETRDITRLGGWRAYLREVASA